VLISLVSVSFWLRKRCYGTSDSESLCRTMDAIDDTTDAG